MREDSIPTGELREELADLSLSQLATIAIELSFMRDALHEHYARKLALIEKEDSLDRVSKRKAVLVLDYMYRLIKFLEFECAEGELSPACLRVVSDIVKSEVPQLVSEGFPGRKGAAAAGLGKNIAACGCDTDKSDTDDLHVAPGSARDHIIHMTDKLVKRITDPSEHRSDEEAETQNAKLAKFLPKLALDDGPSFATKAGMAAGTLALAGLGASALKYQTDPDFKHLVDSNARIVKDNIDSGARHLTLRANTAKAALDAKARSALYSITNGDTISNTIASHLRSSRENIPSYLQHHIQDHHRRVMAALGFPPDTSPSHGTGSTKA